MIPYWKFLKKGFGEEIHISIITLFFILFEFSANLSALSVWNFDSSHSIVLNSFSTTFFLNLIPRVLSKLPFWRNPFANSAFLVQKRTKIKKEWVFVLILHSEKVHKIHTSLRKVDSLIAPSILLFEINSLTYILGTNYV